MCESCYEEYKPAHVTEQARSVVSLIKAVYELHPVGGAAHIVVDDWNLEDGDIQWCIRKADPDEVTLKCLQAMLRLSFAERVAAMAIYEGYIQ